MDSKKEKELIELGEEMTRREQEFEKEWWKTHERKGYDGGPTDQRIELTREFAKRYGEILEKYKNSEPGNED